MHVLSVEIENLRSVERLEWAVRPEDTAGFHVVLGNNGAGKTTFLRSIALALVGPENIYGLRQSGDDWLRRGTDQGTVHVSFSRHEGFDRFSTAGKPPRELAAVVRVARSGPEAHITVDPEEDGGRSLDRSVWAPDARGWVCCGFGPYRRFAGGVPMSSPPKPSLARAMSLFDEQFSLTDALTWLVDLWVARELSKTATFDRVRRFINQPGFLPHDVRLDRVEVTPNKRVFFVDAARNSVPVEELSDGFRSALSLVLELLRQLILAFGEERVFSSVSERIEIPFVALIDEVDAHLHPTWQRRIGDFLVTAFPLTQFVVSTHSPLVCQCSAKGSIFLLPEPGTDEVGRFLDDQESARLRLGNVLDAYGTNVFGVGVAQSESGKRMGERLAALNARELFNGPLNDADKTERDELRAALPTEAAALPGDKLEALIDKLATGAGG